MSSRRILIASCLYVALAAVGAPAAEPVKPKDGPLGMKFVPLPKATFYMGWNGEKEKKGDATRFWMPFSC